MSTSVSKIRTRACGIVINDQNIALVQLQSPVINQPVWMPPGGGVQPGESLREAVQREVEEECGLQVSAGKLMYINELITENFHTLGYYFLCDYLGGELKLGQDPERSEQPILLDVQWFGLEELRDVKNLYPPFLCTYLQEDLGQTENFIRFLPQEISAS